MKIKRDLLNVQVDHSGKGAYMKFLAIDHNNMYMSINIDSLFLSVYMND